MIRDSIQGRAWKFGSNVSTDSIAPGRLISLRANPPEYAKHVLEDNRPDFVQGVKKDDFIVADRNFGCGSSREIAPIIIKLAGVGAAAEKDPLPVLPMGVASEIVYTQGSGSHEVDPDPAASAKLGENEYLGTSTLCMGNELAVKVKMEGDKIAAIDIVQQQETAGVGSLALEALPARIIEAQSTEVDAVAGATVSSTALKDAVNNALAQVK